MNEVKDIVVEWLIGNGPKLIGAAVLLILGLWVIKGILKMISVSLHKSRIDKSLHSFIKSLTGFFLKIVLLITTASMLNIPMTTFVAILGAAGLSIGFALKDSLSNLAGGILILVFRPFNTGDFIEAQGYMGTVNEIQLLYTSINTPDNKRVVIPNGELANAKLVNFSVEKTRRVDMKFGVSYDANIIDVKELLTDIVMNHPLTFKEPAPLVRVIEHGDSAIVFTVRVWCESQNYWPVYYDLQEEVKLRFDENNISIPFPQMDVHLKKE